MTSRLKKVSERRVRVHVGPGPSRRESVRESFFNEELKELFVRLNGKWLPKRGKSEEVRRIVERHLMELSLEV